MSLFSKDRPSLSQVSVTDMNVRSRSRITSIAELIFFARDLALVQAKFIILCRARSLHDDSELILLVGIELLSSILFSLLVLWSEVPAGAYASMSLPHVFLVERCLFRVSEVGRFRLRGSTELPSPIGVAFADAWGADCSRGRSPPHDCPPLAG